MESEKETQPSSVATAADAHELLTGLDADRASLARRTRAPRWLLVVLALAAAGYVGGAAVPDDGGRTAATGGFIVVFVVLALMYPRLTGVRVRRFTWRSWLVVIGTMLATLMLLSIALGLAASLSAWWVTIPAVACFPLVLGAGFVLDHINQRDVRRGR